MKPESRIDEQVFNLMDALRSPIITFETSWADTIPPRLLNTITMSRMASLIKGEELATYPEVVAYIYTRSMIAPMSGEWFDVYMHVSCKVCEDYWQENVWEKLEGKKVLSDYENNQFLLPLRRFIYEKRRKVLKERLKTERPKAVEPQEMAAPSLPKVVQCKLSLFDE